MVCQLHRQLQKRDDCDNVTCFATDILWKIKLKTGLKDALLLIYMYPLSVPALDEILKVALLFCFVFFVCFFSYLS